VSVQLWQAVAGGSSRTTAAWLTLAPDYRLVLSLSDTDAVELGVELTRNDAAQLWEALGRVLGEDSRPPG
jgi:hypothetical protein